MLPFEANPYTRVFRCLSLLWEVGQRTRNAWLVEERCASQVQFRCLRVIGGEVHQAFLYAA